MNKQGTTVMMIFYEEAPDPDRLPSTHPWRAGLIVLCVASFAVGGYFLTGHSNGSKSNQAIVTKTQGNIARGRVTDFQGKPIARATVTLTDPFGTVIATITTDFNGTYEARVSPGTYSLKAMSGNQEINKQITVASTGTAGGDIQLDIPPQ